MTRIETRWFYSELRELVRLGGSRLSSVNKRTCTNPDFLSFKIHDLVHGLGISD
jgi:hypothetical protein